VLKQGIWPSVLGQLYSILTLLDNADGIYDGKQTYSKIYELQGLDDGTPTSSLQLGYSIAFIDSLGILIISIDGIDVIQIMITSCKSFCMVKFSSETTLV
jgi:hypothetical protein